MSDAISASTVSASETASLTWRIDDDFVGGARKGWLGLVLSTALMVVLLYFVAPGPLRVPMAIGLLALTCFRLLFQWRLDRLERSWRIGEGENARLDAEGFHWKMAHGQWRTLARERVRGFRFAPDALTSHSVTALTLNLEDDWESQPIELYPPATIDAVRAYLAGQWKMPETPLAAEQLSQTLVEALGAACHTPPLNSAKRALWSSRLPLDEMTRSLSSDARWRKVAAIEGWGASVSFSPHLSRFVVSPDESTSIAFEAVECASLHETLTALEPIARKRFALNRDVLAERLQGALGELSVDELTLRGTSQREALVEFLTAELAADALPPLASLAVSCAIVGRNDISVDGRFADTAGGLRFWGVFHVESRAKRVTGEIDASREKDEIEAAVRLLGAAERCGFLSEIIAAKSEWRLTGGRNKLLALCDRFDVAAERLEPSPLGARPRLLQLGDPEMPLTLGFGEGAAVEGDILWLDRDALHGLTARLREAVDGASPGDTIRLALSLRARDRWQLVIGVRQNNAALAAEDLYREEA